MKCYDLLDKSAIIREYIYIFVWFTLDRGVSEALGE